MNEVVDLPAEVGIPATIEIEHCELCGCAIEDVEELIYLRASDLVAQWEHDDPRDAWRHTGDLAPPANVRNSDITAKPANGPKPYRTPKSTIDAFWYVVRLGDPERLAAWLDDHPKDELFLLNLLESK
jgi:hypothetical protein